MADSISISDDPVQRERRLEAWFAARATVSSPVLVGFSGGVDSTYLLAVGHGAAPGAVIAVTADSPSLARSTLDEARAFCAQQGIAHRIVATSELDEPAYRANDGQRCFHCKSALLTAMQAVLADSAGGTVALGAITDDLADWRPGMRAAQERGASFPLIEAGFDKAAVRERSRMRGLASWNRPAEPCLSSRVPYGEEVTVEGLAMIEQAEAALRFHGFPTCRARHHRIGSAAATARGWLCRIEVPVDELPRLVQLREQLVPALQRIGYTSVTVDLAGFASGGFNRLLSGTKA